MKSKILLAVLLALASGCGSLYLSRMEAGPDGALAMSYVKDGHELLVEGRGGRLHVDDRDHGPLSEGDVVELRSSGDVYVNGQRRKPTEG